MCHVLGMMNIRKANERGHANHGWLDTYHTFSFADYYDPQWMGFRSLRVINDDLVMPGMGFGTHPHRDMEIITYVRTGAITHQDSIGNKGRTGAGDVQVMSAGTGVTHAEYNLEDEDTTLFQIWIETDRRTAVRVLELVEAVMRDPFGGIGKPEPLKYVLAGAWSRRITQEHRLVYVVSADRIEFLQARYHY